MIIALKKGQRSFDKQIFIVQVIGCITNMSRTTNRIHLYFQLLELL
jgi:hypothetical protein